MTTLLYPVHSLRAIEHAAQIALAPGTLMARAGAAIAKLAQSLSLERAGEILVLAGPGNNGGDALIAAYLLHNQGLAVRVALLNTPDRYRGDALPAWQDWYALDTRAANTLYQPALLDLKETTLIIDGLFGIGYTAVSSAVRPQPPRARDWIAQVNQSGLPVLSIDVPSGLDADTGHVADVAMVATHTLTLLAHKPGLYTADGPDYCGQISVDALGVDVTDLPLTEAPTKALEAGTLNAPALFKAAFQPRRRNSHKGQFGSLAVVGGAASMVGAALLAARMGLHAGAGRTYVQLLAETAPAFDVLQPELMLRPHLHDLDLQALVLGPGMGMGAHLLLAELLARNAPIVLDADALNTIAGQLDLCEAVASRTQVTILTPHPLEAARLLDTTAAAVQANRIATAQELARHYRSIVLLKGAGSVIARPDGQWVINPVGNPALATGGTGDVLAGLLGALLAQGMQAWPAALAATWLHGAAADTLRNQDIGPVGLTASELIPAIRALLNQSMGEQEH